MAMAAMAAVIYAFMMWWFRKTNRARDRGTANGEMQQDLTREEAAELGEKNLEYRYTY